MTDESRPGTLEDLVLLQAEAISFLATVLGRALVDTGAFSRTEYASMLTSSGNFILEECGNSLMDG